MYVISYSLNPEFSKYYKNYYLKSLLQCFDTTQCPSSKFKKLIYDSSNNKYTRLSIDKSRAAVQAELENIIIKLTRVNTLEIRQVDLEFKIKYQINENGLILNSQSEQKH